MIKKAKKIVMIGILSTVVACSFILPRIQFMDNLYMGPGTVKEEAETITEDSPFSSFHSVAVRFVVQSSFLDLMEINKVNKAIRKMTGQENGYVKVFLSEDDRSIVGKQALNKLARSSITQEDEQDYRKEVISAVKPYIGNIQNDIFVPGEFSGSSDGMIKSLQIIQTKSGQNLTKERKIAGTGAIDASGNILTIGSLDKKIIAAAIAEVDLLLVPKKQEEQAKETLNELNTTMEVKGFETLNEVLQYLGFSQ